MAKHGSGHARYSIVKLNAVHAETWDRKRGRCATVCNIHIGREDCAVITNFSMPARYVLRRTIAQASKWGVV